MPFETDIVYDSTENMRSVKAFKNYDQVFPKSNICIEYSISH